MPTLNEVPEVAQLLATILTGEPVTHGALAVIPLLAPNLDDWLTLKEAGHRGERGRQRPAPQDGERGRPAASAAGRRGTARRHAEPHPQHHRAGEGPHGGNHPYDLPDSGGVTVAAAAPEKKSR